MQVDIKTRSPTTPDIRVCVYKFVCMCVYMYGYVYVQVYGFLWLTKCIKYTVFINDVRPVKLCNAIQPPAINCVSNQPPGVSVHQPPHWWLVTTSSPQQAAGVKLGGYKVKLGQSLLQDLTRSQTSWTRNKVSDYTLNGWMSKKIWRSGLGPAGQPETSGVVALWRVCGN